ncbi:TPA: DNA-primase RepB domain-containing protein [Haemophilus influenzae]
MSNSDLKKGFLLHQLESLNNNKFSLLLVDRKKDKTAFVYAKDFSIDDIVKSFSELEHYNNDSFDVYVKHEEGNFFNLIIDDLTQEKAKLLLEEYHIDYMLCSSKNNFQSIINLDKARFSKEQADHIVKVINKKFGDEKFSGANHYFRLCGFNNKKSKNNNELVTPVHFENKVDKQTSTNKLLALVQNLNSNSNTNTSVHTTKMFTSSIDDRKKRIAEKEVKAEIALCKKIFHTLDWSVVDYRIVQRLYKLNYKPDEISEALILFTDFQDRHSNPVDYLNRTITNAINALD